jgi:hypothetical protein
MSVVQITYLENQAIAQAGMIASGDHSIDTRICETAAGIAFGVAVGQGTADRGAVIGAAAAAGFVGVSVQDMSVENDPANSNEYHQLDTMGVITRGDVWVVTGGIVTAGADVTFASTTGILSSAATSGTQFAIAGARWMTGAASGALALLRLSGSLPSA